MNGDLMLLLWLLCGLGGALIGASKNRKLLGLAYGFFLGPLGCIIMVFAEERATDDWSLSPLGLLLILLLTGIGCGVLWMIEQARVLKRAEEPGAPPISAALAAAPAATPEPDVELPEGQVALIAPVALQIPGGVIGYPPGTVLRVVSRRGRNLKVTDEEHTLSVDLRDTTTSATTAARLARVEAAQQAQLTAVKPLSKAEWAERAREADAVQAASVASARASGISASRSLGVRASPVHDTGGGIIIFGPRRVPVSSE